MHLRDAEPGTLLRATRDLLQVICAAHLNSGAEKWINKVPKGETAWVVSTTPLFVVLHMSGDKSWWAEPEGSWEIVPQDVDTQA